MRGDEGVDETESPRLVNRRFELFVGDESADRQASVVFRQRVQGEGQRE